MPAVSALTRLRSLAQDKCSRRIDPVLVVCTARLLCILLVCAAESKLASDDGEIARRIGSVHRSLDLMLIKRSPLYCGL